MYKHFYSSIMIFSLLVISTHSADAHAINKHLEELYGASYLPFFIFAKLLPFIGLGLLAKKLTLSITNPQMPVFFILGITIGLVTAFQFEGFESAFLINNISIILSGILLLIPGNITNRLFVGLLLFFGLTLGYEHGLYLSHAHKFTWLYLLILGSGIAVFAVLSFFPERKVKFRKAVLQSVGVFLILCGITAVLLT